MSAHDSILAEARMLIQAHGGYAWRLHQGSRVRGDAGIPDLYALVRVPLREEIERLRAELHRMETLAETGAQTAPAPLWFDAKPDPRETPSRDQRVFAARHREIGIPVLFGRAAELVDYLRSRGVNL